MSNTNKKESRKASVWKQLSIPLTGLKVRIVKSSSEDLEGIRGIIRDETHNLLKIETKNKFLSIPKSHQIFEIETKDGSLLLVDGQLLVGNPENRIKKKIRSW